MPGTGLIDGGTPSPDGIAHGQGVRAGLSCEAVACVRTEAVRSRRRRAVHPPWGGIPAKLCTLLEPRPHDMSSRHEMTTISRTPGHRRAMVHEGTSAGVDAAAPVEPGFLRMVGVREQWR